MSASATPITAELFALAIKDLPASTLHFKVLEIRTSIAQLEYSNEQMLPFTTNDEPDQDCVDAIKENEGVIERQNERLGLLRIEVEQRGMSWREFSTTQEYEEQGENNNAPEMNGDMVDGSGNLVNGVDMVDGGGNLVNGVHHDGVPNGQGNRILRRENPTSDNTSSPWTDGTFTTGTINNGTVTHNHRLRYSLPRFVPPVQSQTSNLTRQLRTDAELRRAMMERMGEDMEEDDGVHL